MSRSKVSSVGRDALDRELERSRVDPAGAVAQQPPDLARAAARRARRPAAPPARRSSRRLQRARRSSALGPTPGSCGRRTAPGTRPRARPGTTMSPPGLRRSLATLATTLHDATPSEHVRLVAPRRPPARPRRPPRASRKVARDLAEVEVALVEAGPLDRRHDLAHGRPDRLRVLAVERSGAGGRRPPGGSGAAPRRSSSPSGSRTAARGSSRSRRRRGRAGRRRR